MAPPSALLVEDAPEFALLGRAVLEREGYAVVHAGSAEEALTLAEEHDFELFVVDVGLPGIDGFELCRRLRRQSDAYVVMVTGHGEEAERVAGLRLGADDYVTKPYSPDELGARVQALRRRPRSAPTSAASATPRHRIDLDTAARVVRVDGCEVELTRIEFDLLAVLAAAEGAVVTRADLLGRVWGYADGDDHVVSVHLGNLRRKLRAAAPDVDPVRTVRGVGYRWEAV